MAVVMGFHVKHNIKKSHSEPNGPRKTGDRYRLGTTFRFKFPKRRDKRTVVTWSGDLCKFKIYIKQLDKHATGGNQMRTANMPAVRKRRVR